MHDEYLPPKTTEYIGRNREVIPNLKAQRDELNQRMIKIDKLLNLLENNPEFVQMLDLTRELI